MEDSKKMQNKEEQKPKDKKNNNEKDKNEIVIYHKSQNFFD